MGRERTNPVRKYFVYDRQSNVSLCQIDNCNFNMKGDHAANLERHIQRNHPDIYSSHALTKSSSSKRGLSQTEDSPNKRQACQPTLLNVLEGKGAKPKVSKKQIVTACVELVVKNGRPFQLMEDSGFRKLLDPLIEIAGGRFAINSKSIRAQVCETAAKTRQRITEVLKDRLISLKIDCATRLDRAILGVNAQYVENGRVVVQTLAMKELYERHTAEYIKLQVQEVLAGYKIEMTQIYSVTTDNGSNMLKAATLLSDVPDDVSDEEDKESSFDDISDVIVEEVNFSSGHHDSLQFQSIRCAAHTLQLAVNDALKEKTSVEIISKCRKICKKLRTQTLMSLIRKLKLKKPVLDCPTRWMSTVAMLRRLLELRGFCADMFTEETEFFLADEDWNLVQISIETLTPAEEATKRLQLEQLTLGEFYSIWISCREKTAKMSSELSFRVVAAMRSRETCLVGSELFCASVFMDLRYHLLLSEDQKNTAKLHLTKLWKRLAAPARQRSKRSPGDLESLSLDKEDSVDDEVEMMLREKDVVRATATSVPCISTFLEHLQLKPRISRDTDIHQYWESKREQMAELKALAEIVLAVPATQVSVESAFSALKYVLSDQRARLAPHILEDILIVRSAWSS
ncbi:uncharacterized protein LOC135384700 [Ornithodoros turicata]|uniref:uncharacterized protein LOC135384700 n=1 Tax=Ornithodoros turicata TaxID=34597 RepID=UPI003139691B